MCARSDEQLQGHSLRSLPPTLTLLGASTAHKGGEDLTLQFFEFCSRAISLFRKAEIGVQVTTNLSLGEGISKCFAPRIPLTLLIAHC